MSSLAINSIGDEPRTVWEYRSEFLRDGVRYSQFLCPFCKIELTPVLVYEIGELSKSPHFRKKSDHIGQCDGEPIFEDVERHAAKKHLVPRDMTFPESFIKRQRPRITNTINIKPSTQPPTAEEIDELRKRAGSIGIRRTTASLLQPFVEAYNSVWSEAFKKYADPKKLERNNWVRDVLSKAPLHLGSKNITNYSDAFRYPNFRDKSLERIYHEKGILRKREGIYFLEGSCAFVKDKQELTFSIRIDPAIIDTGQPKSQVELLKQLDQYFRDQAVLRWYAYGLPQIIDGIFTLEIQSLDDLYLKKAYGKRVS